MIWVKSALIGTLKEWNGVRPLYHIASIATMIHLFVAAKNEEVIGFILTFIRDDIGYIGWVAVTEKYRRKGIGTELVKRAVTSLKEKGIRTVASHVRFDDSSLAILEKNGFKRSNEIKIEMIKEI